MGKIYVDSSAFIGLYSRDDVHKPKADDKSKFLQEEHIPIVTSYGVLDETATVLSQRVSKAVACSFLEEVLAEDGPELLELSSRIRDEAYGIFKQVGSKNISVVDCQIVALCGAHNIKTIFSFDKHFTKLGLTLL
jgi:predicted nucleic acid-binding protein